MGIAALTTAIVAGAMAFAFRPEAAESGIMWLALAAPYAALSIFALYRFRHDGTLRDRFAFHWGDFSIGAFSGGALILCAWLFKQGVLPSGSPQVAWLFRLLYQLGNVQRVPAIAFAIVFIAAMEELVWRGLVQDALTEKLGTRRAFFAAAACYAVAHVPTIFTLQDPEAGLNPLVVVAALGCGTVWGFGAFRFGRLPPVIISHVTFTYFTPAIVLTPF